MAQNHCDRRDTCPCSRVLFPLLSGNFHQTHHAATSSSRREWTGKIHPVCLMLVNAAAVKRHVMGLWQRRASWRVLCLVQVPNFAETSPFNTPSQVDKPEPWQNVFPAAELTLSPLGWSKRINFPCSLSRNTTPHSMKKLDFHSLLRPLYYQFSLLPYAVSLWNVGTVCTF